MLELTPVIFHADFVVCRISDVHIARSIHRNTTSGKGDASLCLLMAQKESVPFITSIQPQRAMVPEAKICLGVV